MSKVHHSSVTILIGFLLLCIFALALMMQVQTNEAFLLHGGQVNIYKPNWAILMQIPNLMLGNLSASEAAAAFFGWFVEAVYLAFIIGYELTISAVEKSGQRMAKWFRTAAFGIVGLNIITDYNYGSIGFNGWMGHLLFALFLSIAVGFFWTIGIAFLELGWKHA